uniref:Uncharacterized protein n=1 Tax=Aegilops tauschii TaxID=37682 RepID=M8B8N2_AEGTA
MAHQHTAGADVNFIDSAGVACVMVAAEYGLPGIMKCLLDAGANPNVTSRFGATPIEVAALKDRREIVEMLFPLTSPIPTLPEWSIDGIISHVKSFGLEPLFFSILALRQRTPLLQKKVAFVDYVSRDEHQYEKKKSELKLQATEAFKRNDYLTAGRLYSDDYEKAREAFADGLKLDPTSVEIASALRKPVRR